MRRIDTGEAFGGREAELRVLAEMLDALQTAELAGAAESPAAADAGIATRSVLGLRPVK